MAARRGDRPTLTDVARLSGVSIASVSYVLNDRPDKSLSTATRERVLAAAAELGYVPNAAAASLRRGHNRIVVVVTDATLAGETGAQLVSALTAGVAELGHPALTHENRSEERLCEVVASVQPFALLLASFVSSATRERLSALGVRHVVGLGPRPEGADDGDRFWEMVIGEAQVRHLAGLGHTRLAFLLPGPHSSRLLTARARLSGAQAACAQLGLAPPVAVPVPLVRETVATELAGLRQAGVTAVCAHDNRTAVAVLAAMSDLGWTAPGDMALVGVGDTWHARLTTPLLSTVRMRGMDLTARAAEWLAAAIAGGGPTDVSEALRAALPPVEAVRRETT
ncbi:LacI family DNA-binding transcriptional regulator [Trujillonella endophytica]|uniref:DNA-binding transcriptional regulator, LacI/PurR family n=1 Tax=Trujillonella endophytica TaxID=673521 RepID=A0A1H8Q5V1_9ACTN|nr:LacI family DNA-binding transcriptional regulator [Trujillella endophytica]SEO49294.1 DNA-binding transcriptional regulator, LacI/PurR family [Trujillella endophytica]